MVTACREWQTSTSKISGVQVRILNDNITTAINTLCTGRKHFHGDVVRNCNTPREAMKR